MSQPQRTTAALRGACILGGLYLSAAAGWRTSAHTLAALRSPGRAASWGFEDVLLALCALGLTASLAWLSLVATVAVAEIVLSGSTRARICPRPIRRLVLVGCGAALSAGLATPALADTDTDPGRVAGLPLPDRVNGLRVADTATGTRQMQVRRGDSLWLVAERRLPASATDAEISRAWRAIYRRNAAALGADPDLIFPGTSLRLPDPHPTTEERKPR